MVPINHGKMLGWPGRVNKLSTPQMELNAAVLSKRGREVIELLQVCPTDR